MFERFTDRARRVVVLAQDEARSLRHTYIGTEHLLLGLLREGEGLACAALEALGIRIDAVRREVEQIIGLGASEQEESGHIPFTPRAKKVLELSLREALQIGHDYIGTEHILLGLLREGHGVAVQIMRRLGSEPHVVRQQVIREMHGEGGAPTSAAAGSATVRSLSVPVPGMSGRRERTVLTGFRSQLAAIEARLAAVEKRVGVPLDEGDLDAEISRIRGDRQAAVEAQNYESAAELRDREHELLAEQAARLEEWSAAHPTLAALAQTVRELSAEVRRLAELVGGPSGQPAASASNAEATGATGDEPQSSAEGTG
jgi:hypothetical protein